jgi:hypothetical protein
VTSTPEFHGLASNPFYEKYDHELVGETRRLQLKRVMEIIRNSANSRAPFIVTMTGTVGMGKSFTLIVLTKEFESESFRSKEGAILPVKMDAILAVGTGKYIQYVVTSTFRELGKQSFLVLRSRFDTEIAKQRRDPEKVLTEIHPDFRNAFLRFRDNEELIWAWLTGEKADLRDLKKIGIKNRIDSPTIALRILQEFCKVLKITGHAGLLLCLDEAEELALGGPRKLVEILTMLKKILEQSKSQMSNSQEDAVPISFCLGFTPETLNLITGEEFIGAELRRTGGAGLNTFLRRMSREARFRLDPFTNDDAAEFIRVILNKARQKPLQTHTPFETAAIGYINSLSRGIPATIIDACRVCLEVADETKTEKITADDCQRWLIDRGVIPETSDQYAGGEDEAVSL